MADKKINEKFKFDLSLVSYTFGILSIVFAIFNPPAGIVLGIIGLFQTRKQTDKISKKARILLIIGLILGIIFTLAGIYMAYYEASAVY